MGEIFHKFAEASSRATGTPWAFCIALALVLIWAVSGPFFGFSDTWQLVINTGTTIVTFIMVFLIQNAQNRDCIAQQLKLDELLWAVKGARVEMINLEQLSDQELAVLQARFQEIGRTQGRSPIAPEEPGKAVSAEQ